MLPVVNDVAFASFFFFQGKGEEGLRLPFLCVRIFFFFFFCVFVRSLSFCVADFYGACAAPSINQLVNYVNLTHPCGQLCGTVLKR